MSDELTQLMMLWYTRARAMERVPDIPEHDYWEEQAEFFEEVMRSIRRSMSMIEEEPTETVETEETEETGLGEMSCECRITTIIKEMNEDDTMGSGGETQ